MEPISISGNECNRNLSFPQREGKPESQVIHSQENAVREHESQPEIKELAFEQK